MQYYEILEKEWGEFVGNPNVVVCSSGTAALHLALEAMQLPKDSEVIVPDFSMIACARAITLAGLRPVFVDCNRNDLLINTSLLENEITANTSAIMPVHVYGRRCDMKYICSMAVQHKLKIVEDMAEMHGVTPSQYSDAVCWSFYKNKIVAGEEGGAVVFNAAETFGHTDRARQLRSLGFTDAHDFRHIPRGHNYRIANILAEPILRSLKNYEKNAKMRREIEAWYDFYTPEEWIMPNRDAVWVYDVRLPVPGIVEPVVKELNERGIAARCSFKPMRCQHEYRTHLDCHESKSEAFKASREIMYLPVYPGLGEGAVRDTIVALREAVIKHSPVADAGLCSG